MEVFKWIFLILAFPLVMLAMALWIGLTVSIYTNLYNVFILGEDVALGNEWVTYYTLYFIWTIQMASSLKGEDNEKDKN